MLQFPSRLDQRGIGDVQGELGSDLQHLINAQIQAQNQLKQLHQATRDLSQPDTSLVVLGSLAREEITSQSDLDWLLLLDGQVSPEHKQQEEQIRQVLIDLNFIKPGASGLFGTMVASHDLVHEIGGASDSNANTTRRILLLLESAPLWGDGVYTRVRRQILRRYIDDDYGFRSHRNPYRVPRFLLNDITRYWRTITVDYVYKQRNDPNGKWALRNVKLRMSRKLIFASGLLTCLACSLASEAEHKLADTNFYIDFLETNFTLAPLKRMATLLFGLGASREITAGLFESYNDFIGLLNSDSKRAALSSLKPSDLESSPEWAEVRLFGDAFHAALVDLFFESNDDLTALTREYGVF